jgi:hypothetical protein
MVVAWLLRQREGAITVQELTGLYRTARRWLALPRSPAVAMGALVAKDGNSLM